MQTFFLIILAIFGLLFGSFASVIIYRLKSGEGGIMTGRSHCGTCNKILNALDLIPLFSWLFNKGKCRQCQAKVSGLYPLLETTTAILFASIGYFLIDVNLIQTLEFSEFIKLFFWLIIGFISIIYIFYDILFLEISERVLATGVGVMVTGIIIQTYTSIEIFSNLPHIQSLIENSQKNLSIYSAIILILTIIGLYVIVLKGFKLIWDTIILISLWLIIYLTDGFITGVIEIQKLTDYTIFSAIIGALSIFTFFFIQYLVGELLHYLEKRKGIKESEYRFADGIIGGGDFRIAIMVGLGLGASLTFPAMMITYFVGSIIGVGFLIYQKSKSNSGTVSTTIPFGPFLAIGFFIAIFFQDYIQHFMDSYLFI